MGVVVLHLGPVEGRHWVGGEEHHSLVGQGAHLLVWELVVQGEVDHLSQVDHWWEVVQGEVVHLWEVVQHEEDH